MALFYLQIQSVSRGAGRSSTASAAYRAGERIRDERTNTVHNHARRRDVLHTEIFVPQQLADQPLEWARNRERLWNTAEHAEKRHNSRVAREFVVNLPAELAAAQRVTLARTFAAEVAERYGVAVDLAVHEPRPDGDPRNFHAHLLATTRTVTPAGLAAKAGLDMAARERARRNLPDHRQEYVSLRERWAQLANGALREAGIEARIDHRSFAAQGIEREPKPRIPIMLVKMERSGVRSELAERLRAQYQERSRLRAERAEQTRAKEAAAVAAPAGSDLEAVRRHAREAWLRLREAATAPASAERTPAAEKGHEAEDDLSR